MIVLTLGEVAAIVAGRLHGADPATPVTGTVEFDSRQVTPGGLFLAIEGAHVDGHEFAGEALARGAVAGIVTREVAGPSIVVDDAFGALAALAAAVIRRLPETMVIAVTGSSGKTSTKDLVAQLLRRLGPTVAPPGSFNNELGHPYTVLRATPDTRFLVVETSARGVGHIRFLTEIAPPHIGVVLNVGSAHLGEFGSREAIALAKGELVEALPADGVAVLNADDPHVAAMAARTPARIVRVGENADADVRATGIALDELGRAAFTLGTAAGSAEVRLRLVGRHHVGNALAAAAVALECGMPLPDLAAALSAATPVSRWRMDVSERADGVLVINDAYNANPESMRAALDALAAVVAARRALGVRAFAVLGEMAELGASAPAEHEAIGRYAAQQGIARVVAVGDPARSIERGAALEGSWDGDASWVPDAGAAVALLRDELRARDVVLVKASRAASLERVALAIADDTVSGFGTPPEPDESGGNGGGRA
jgi:UDP-N-acetylmuramoyl-tripeptide--D-alanyl-D-alanine ligase